jgi:hypothetical protein
MRSSKGSTEVIEEGSNEFKTFNNINGETMADAEF